MGISCWVHSDRLNYSALNKLIRDKICNDVFLLVISSEYVFYETQTYPWRRTPIPLNEIVKILQEGGLSVHGWIVTLLKGNKDFSLENIDMYHVSKTGKSIVFNPPYLDSYKWLDPVNPKVEEFVLNLVKETIEKVPHLESIHLDYIRYPDNPLAPGVAKNYGVVSEYNEEFDYGHSTIAIKMFKDEVGLDPRNLKYGSVEFNTWMKWRADRIRHLVKLIEKLCSSMGIKLGADVFPTPEIGYNYVLQKWDEWGIELYIPMLYHKYWINPVIWIIETSLELRDRGLPIVPGLHLEQLSREDVPYVVQTLLEEIGKISMFVYPPKDNTMEENWETLKKTLVKIGSE